MNVHNESQVAQFYAGKNIFITGGTGFLGKCLIEKVLRSCPDVGTIYMLCRAKKGKTPPERLDALFKEMLFDKLRAQDPEVFKKIVPVIGDVMDDKLGLSEEDEKLITDNANILIHSAATIRFDEHIKGALLLNVGGVVKVVELARKTKNLVTFLHVSTAYSNCNLSDIEEVYYDLGPSNDPVKLLALCDWMDDDAMAAMTKTLIGDRPNTYCLTKAVAEAYLFRHAKDLPLAIFRPSIIGASWQEPVPGWIDNMNGPSGLFIAIGKGALRILKGNQDVTIDVIPIDFCVNMMLCIGWYTAQISETVKDPLIYHCTSCNKNPYTFLDLGMQLFESFHYNTYYNDVFRSPHIAFASNVIELKFWIFFTHWIPAYAADAVSKLKGNTKFSMVRMMDRIHKASGTFAFFTSRQWNWSSTTGDSLMSKLSDVDKNMFNFDVNDLDWSKYYPNYYTGLKKYVLKEDMSPEKLQTARNSQLRWANLTFLVETVVAPILVLCVIYSFFSL